MDGGTFKKVIFLDGLMRCITLIFFIFLSDVTNVVDKIVDCFLRIKVYAKTSVGNS